MKKRTVLIVDDEPGILRSLALYLKDEFRVLKAASGLEAWQVIQRLHIDWLVTDLKMPGMGGLELLEKVRGSGYKMKVILSSGYVNDVEDKVCLLKIDHCLQKPYSPITLVEILRSC
ncbi:MAG: response regulator [Deltaproteobacteria bacterium]|nr:response regulator [Deltaproteobacteria bacterium]